MFGVLLLFFTAVAVSLISAYFSIIGLVALFAATPISVAVMGATLEFAKLVTAAWLHKNWYLSPKILKGYLVSATVILMVITSVGIFGFLSKGHLDQKGPIPIKQAQVLRNTETIKKLEQSSAKSTNDIEILDQKISEWLKNQQTSANSQTNNNTQPLELQIQQLDQQIQIQKDIIVRNQDVFARLDRTVAALETQNRSQQAIQERTRQRRERAQLSDSTKTSEAKIVEIQNEKIKIQQQIVEVKNKPIQIDSNSNPFSTNKAELNQQIANNKQQIDALENQNINLNAEINETTAKLGPIQYIADLFGIKNTEFAVKFMILLIMLAFDPVAVALLIAAQWSLANYQKTKNPNQQTSIEEFLALQQIHQDQQKNLQNIIEEKHQLTIQLDDSNKKIQELNYKIHQQKEKVIINHTEINELQDAIHSLQKEKELVENQLSETSRELAFAESRIIEYPDDLKEIIDRIQNDPQLRKGLLSELRQEIDPNQGIKETVNKPSKLSEIQIKKNIGWLDK